jgi:hypothetical protein
MSLNSEWQKKLDKIEDIFRDELSTMHERIIDGSPVDTGRFKTSWQLLDFKPRELKFHLYNPVPYGLKLWRFGTSKKGWSPMGGDVIVRETEQRLAERLRSVK